MRTPSRCDLVVPGQHRVGVVGNVEHAEVGNIKRVRKAPEGDRAE